jgi:antitoxin component of RelBE/YafQ-DinJ toxin-antitoxin module
MKRTTSYNLDEAVIDRIQDVAEKQGLTASALVNRILKASVEKHDLVVEGLRGVDVWELVEELARQGKRKKKK